MTCRRGERNCLCVCVSVCVFVSKKLKLVPCDKMVLYCCFDTILQQCDRHTGRWTDRHRTTAYIPRYAYASRGKKKTPQRQLIISIRVYRLPSLNRPRLIHIKPKAIQILTVGMQVSISTTITRINRENTDRRQENYRTHFTSLFSSHVDTAMISHWR